jgi:hypothetical protein
MVESHSTCAHLKKAYSLLERHKKLVETTMKALRDAIFPGEVAHYRDVLLKLDLTPAEQEELRKVLWEKIG